MIVGPSAMLIPCVPACPPRCAILRAEHRVCPKAVTQLCEGRRICSAALNGPPGSRAESKLKVLRASVDDSSIKMSKLIERENTFAAHGPAAEKQFPESLYPFRRWSGPFKPAAAPLISSLILSEPAGAGPEFARAGGPRATRKMSERPSPHADSGVYIPHPTAPQGA